jgi:hypothetical protein
MDRDVTPGVPESLLERRHGVVGLVSIILGEVPEHRRRCLAEDRAHPRPVLDDRGTELAPLGRRPDRPRGAEGESEYRDRGTRPEPPFERVDGRDGDRLSERRLYPCIRRSVGSRIDSPRT